MLYLKKEIKVAFETNGFLLTGAAGIEDLNKDNLSYEIDQISSLLDFVNLMAFDLHSDRKNITGLNSPLFPNIKEVRHHLIYFILIIYSIFFCRNYKLKQIA